MKRPRLRKYLLPHHSNNFHPHLFRITGVIVGVVALGGLFFISSKLLATLPKISSFAAVYAGMVISYTNEHRQAFGETTFVPNDLLTQAAQLKANDMAEKGYFAHNSPDGKRPWYWIEQAGYNYKYAGENLAIDFVDSKDVTDAWMSSPKHKANILNSDFKEIGVATAVGIYQGKEVTFVVEMFGTPSEKPVRIAQSVPRVEAQTIQTETSSISVPEAVEKRVEGAYTDSSSLFEKVIASPKRTVASIYYIIIAILAALMLLGAIVEFRKHHKGIWLAGGVLIVVAAVLASLMLQYGQGALT